MANHIFVGLAVLSLGATMVQSYGPYQGYEAIDQGIRQVRRCPTCAPDCPEALSSSWYDSPLVYGQSARYRLNNRDYNNPHFGESLNYGNSPCSYSNSRCARRLARNGNTSPMESMAFDSNAGESFDSAASYEPIERRAIMPYGFPNSHAYVPERYQETGNFGVLPTAENRRVSRHYGNSYDSSVRDQSLHQDSVEPNEPRRWSDVGFQPSELQVYENTEDAVYDDRAKAIESPALNKKVYVVYRADADPSMDEDLETSSISRQPETLEESSMMDSRNPMRDSQLEQVVRRAMEGAARQNIRESALYNLQNRRGMYYNDRETDHAALYNPRRAYNEALYQRFNSGSSMDHLQNRNAFASGFRASDVVYPPLINFERYATSGTGNTEDLARQDDSARTDNVQDNVRYDVNSEMSGWENKQWQPIDGTNDEKNGKVNPNEQNQQTVAINENIDVGTPENSKSIERSEEQAEESKDFATAKREITFETPATAAKNYRTYSRSTSETGKNIVGRKETEKTPKIEVTTYQNIKPQDVQLMLKEINPDFLDDMEKPPTVTESTLQLNFDAPESST